MPNYNRYNSVFFIAALAMIVVVAWIAYLIPEPGLETVLPGGNIAEKNRNVEHAYIPTEGLIDEIKKRYSIGAYRSHLSEKQQQLRDGFKNVDLVERITLEREIALLQIKIENSSQFYDDKVNMLFNAYQALKEMKKAFSAQDYDTAQTALIHGGTKQAYELFALVEFKERNAKERELINRAAEAAYQRGSIAQDQLDYRKAYRHYRQAAKFNPNNIQYLLAAGRLAENIALYSNAINYYEAALHMLQKDGNTPRELRPLWVNLGNAWNSKGDTDKAISYFEMALASDLKAYGSIHPNIAVDKNNLGWAWENKGEIDKAIEYYEQALVIYEITLGSAHAKTLQVKENLEIANRLLNNNAGSRNLSK